MAQHRLAMVGAVTAGLTHNFRNEIMPALLHVDALSGLLHEIVLSEHFHIDLLSESVSHAETRFEHELSDIRSSLMSLQKLCVGLRLLSGDPHEPCERRVTHLANWWEDVDPLVRATALAGTVIDHDISPALPDVSMPPSLVTQVLIACVLNARHWMHGSASPALRINARHQGDTVRVVVIHGVERGPRSTHNVRFDPLTFESPLEALSGMSLARLRDQLAEYGGDIEITDYTAGSGVCTILLPVSRGRSRESRRICVRVALSDRRQDAVAHMILTQGRFTTLHDSDKTSDRPDIPDVVICDLLSFDALSAQYPALSDLKNPRWIVIGSRPPGMNRDDVVWIAPSRLGLLSDELERAEQRVS